MKNQVFDVIKQVAQQVTPVGGHVYLYGSHARNEAKINSDWDILIILDKNRIETSDYDNISYPLFDGGCRVNATVNTVLYTKNEWESYRYSLFYKNVERDKIQLA